METIKYGNIPANRDFILVNDDIEKAYRELKEIVGRMTDPLA